MSALGGLVPIVVMGVSGAGKSLIGSLLAERIDGTFIDADDLHSVEATTKMGSGIPLTDDDRWPWLDRVGARLAEDVARGTRPVVACSALRRAYRDRLRGTVAGPILFVLLRGTRDVLEKRLDARAGHFMPATLLDSQLRTLEEFAPDESGIIVSIDRAPESIVEAIIDRALRRPVRTLT